MKDKRSVRVPWIKCALSCLNIVHARIVVRRRERKRGRMFVCEWAKMCE